MIAKKVANPDHSSSKAVRIGSLAAYIRAPESESSTEKCVYYGARGFLTETASGQAAEMLALAEDAVRTRDSINHYVLSWREGERPTHEQVEEAVDIVVDEMGLDEHQLIYGLHADTDNWHLHVMVNRAYLDEETDRVKVRKINRGYDIDSVHRVGARIERAQGWEVEANKRYRVLDDGTLERAGREEPESALGGPGQQQLDRERRTGEKSAVRSASELAASIIAAAGSWEELHARFAERGLRYERSSRARTGAVVTIGEVTVKASRVSREATLRKLESRLGPYRPSDRSRDRAVEPADAAPLIAGAKSWEELHARLGELGLRYEKAGSGARVVAGALEAKASVVSRASSLARLEHRLGPYEPAAATAPEEEPSARKAPAKVDLKAIGRMVAAAKSWGELHATLAREDARYERFGSGARIIAGASVFKASTVGRLASLGALEKRLGAFEPAATTDAAVSREAQALDPDMARVNEYRAARDAYRRERDAEWLDSESGHELQRKALADKQASEREEVHEHDWQGLGAALNAMRSVLAHEHAMERAELREKRRRRREALRRRYPPWPSYEEWLRAEGLPEWAERWRYQRPPTFEGRGGSPAVPRDIRGYEARVDGERVLYRRRGAPSGTPDAFRDVGPRIDVLDWQSEESTLAALELSAAKWGEFVVTGNEEFKSRCARLAAEHGFQITNPELQESIERERARLGAAANVSVDPEPSPEPDVEPGGTPGRTPPAVDPPAGTRDSEPDDAPVPAPPILDAEVERHPHIEEPREQMAAKDDPLRTSSVVVPDSSVLKPPPSPSTGVDFSAAFRVAALVAEQRAQREDEAASQPPAPSGPDVAPVRTPSAEEPPNRTQDLDGTDGAAPFIAKNPTELRAELERLREIERRIDDQIHAFTVPAAQPPPDRKPTPSPSAGVDFSLAHEIAAQVAERRAQREAEELEAAQDKAERMAAWAREAYGVEAVDFYVELQRRFDQDEFGPRDQPIERNTIFHSESRATLRFRDAHGREFDTGPLSLGTLARVRALTDKRPPGEIPELEREITLEIAREIARVRDHGR